MQTYKSLTNTTEEVAIYAFFAIGVLATIFIFSTFNFSYLLTAAGSLQLFGIFIIAYMSYKNKSVSGLSKHMVIAYWLVFVLRSILFRFYRGYLPSDNTGEFFFQFQQLITALVLGYILFLITNQYKRSYNQQFDQIHYLYLLIPSVILAVIFHPNHNDNVIADIIWTFTQLIELMAIVPQFILFHKKGGQIEVFTIHFISLTAASRLISLIFWMDAYQQLQKIGFLFLIMQLLHLLIMIDFLYYYYRSLKSASNIVIPAYV